MTATPDGYVTVLWQTTAKQGKEAELKEFIAAAVTPSRNDAGNIDYEAHEVDAPALSSSTSAGSRVATSTRTCPHRG